MPSYIKQINLNGITYDFNALAIQDESGNAKTWADITRLIQAGFELVKEDSLPTIPSTGQEEFYEEWRNKIVCVPSDNPQTENQSDEYIIQRNGTSPSYTYAWEKIGSTTVDLSDYVHKGTYTSGTPSASVTESAGAESIIVSIDEDATGTGTISYNRVTGVSDHVLEAHNHTVNANTASFTYVTGVAEDGAVSVVTGVTADGTVSALTGLTYSTVDVAIAGITNPGLFIDSSEAEPGMKEYVESISGSAPQLTGQTIIPTNAISGATLKTSTGYATIFNTDAIKSATLSTSATSATGYIKYLEDVANATLSNNTGLVSSVTGQTKTLINTVTHSTGTVMSGATVVNEILSFNTLTAVTAVSAETVTGLTGVTYGTKDVTINNGSKTTKYATITTVSASTASVGISTTAAETETIGITGGSYSATTKYIGITYSDAGTTPVVKSITKNTATVLTGVKASGTATVVKSTGLATESKTFVTGVTLDAGGATTLSHTVNTTATEISVSVSVPIDHSHTIEISNHVHGLNNHTHNVNLN